MDFFNMLLSMNPQAWQQAAQGLTQPMAMPTFRPPVAPAAPAQASAPAGGAAQAQQGPLLPAQLGALPLGERGNFVYDPTRGTYSDTRQQGQQQPDFNWGSSAP